jgi:hypothetical protein
VIGLRVTDDGTGIAARLAVEVKFRFLCRSCGPLGAANAARVLRPARRKLLAGRPAPLGADRRGTVGEDSTNMPLDLPGRGFRQGQGWDSGNSRNGTRAKTVLTDVGPVEVKASRTRAARGHGLVSGDLYAALPYQIYGEEPWKRI